MLRWVRLALQARDLAALGCVSRDLRHLATSDILWEALFVAEFGAPSPSDGLLRVTGGFKPAFAFRWAERARHRRQRRCSFAPSLCCCHVLFLFKIPYNCKPNHEKLRSQLCCSRSKSIPASAIDPKA